MIVFQCFNALECLKNVSLLSHFDKLSAGCFDRLTAGCFDKLSAGFSKSKIKSEKLKSLNFQTTGYAAFMHDTVLCKLERKSRIVTGYFC